MIDIAREIDAVQRGVGTVARPHCRAGTHGPPHPHLRRPDRRRLVRADQPQRIGRWFLPAERRPAASAGTISLRATPAGRSSPANGRPPAAPDVGGRRGRQSRRRLGSRAAASCPTGTTRRPWSRSSTPPSSRRRCGDMFGPGAVGIGWEMGFLGLALHLRGGSVGDPIAWQLSDEGRAYATRSSEAWGARHVASGADPEAAATAVANSTAFYAPPPRIPTRRPEAYAGDCYPALPSPTRGPSRGGPCDGSGTGWARSWPACPSAL